MSADVKKKYIRVKDIPDVYSIGRATIYRLRAKGQITIHKVGKSALVSVSDLESLIKEGG